MKLNRRTLSIALAAASLGSLLPATALAQTSAGASDTDSPALIVLAVLFCLMIVALVAHTAHRMVNLD